MRFHLSLHFTSTASSCGCVVREVVLSRTRLARTEEGEGARKRHQEGIVAGVNVDAKNESGVKADGNES